MPEKTTSESASEWERPDPGLAVTSSINEEAFESDDILHFVANNCSKENIICSNSFINYGVNESGKSSSDYVEKCFLLTEINR